MKERIEELANQIIDMPLMKWDDEVVKQVVTTAVNEALEMAAKECEKRIAGDGEPEDVEHRYCAEAIRKLKG